ncbi:uncharacterized protein BDR25DRAFT_353811 [Lindgomyces ingoldianus]|uniref:Uncharacterized protein n=1 Tax=Lindgomyces ingoldianus TaxID=673940 RepID=A0ACB6R0U1_9PLEO|nr:uncharacterized protein BDR25DRAFT_353811 [Lindgomyces ingoldianus]KAF2472071.1 hypothetical protein BDR25DRAFT_353811 [Lindgomyces ingoldianus]
MQCRKKKVDEDKAYSLLSIFNVKMSLRYGEGSANLRLTDPSNNKKRIKDT